MPTPTHRSVFISHAHADNAVCARYANALRARGIDVWIDLSNAQTGHDLTSDIDRQLRRHSAFLLMVTAASNTSHWVIQERGAYNFLMNTTSTRMVDGVERMILPVRLNDEVPAIFGGILWVDAQHLGFDQAIDAIVSALTITPVGARPASPLPATSPTPPVPDTLPPLGPAPAPRDSTPAHHLTPSTLYNLGFRGYSIRGVECILPPLCPVPSGIFTMGSDKSHDKDAQDRETPQYPVEVGPFAIGQHPVTVAEYACAVRAKAVREPPAYELLGSRMDWQTQLTRPDHPIVCVSWHDAVVYLRWLAGVTGQPWRLPTEAEWEKAARGTDGRIYPWGNTFDKARANTREGGIKTTTPVGRYPTGASPYGAQDMAGNVWEWTSSLFRPYPYNKADGREDQKPAETRVLRGSPWVNTDIGARAAYRNDWPDVSAVYSIGFRLARGAAAGP